MDDRLEFGDLVLVHDGTFWSGTLVLPSFADLTPPSRRKLLVEIAAEERPTAAQQAGIRWLLAKQDAASRAVRRALLVAYPALRRRAGKDVEMPAALTQENLGAHVDLRGVTFHSATRARGPYIGFIFGCTWDGEHGLGVMMQGTRAVEVGGADTALLEWIADRDAKVGGGRSARENQQDRASRAKKPAAKTPAAKKRAVAKRAARR